MLPDRVSNPGPLTYEAGALPIALRGPAANSVEPDQTEFTFCRVYICQSQYIGILQEIKGNYYG